MKVLWFSITPVATGDTREGCWINAQAALISQFCPDISLSIAYQANQSDKRIVDGVTCYAMKPEYPGLRGKIAKALHDPNAEWRAIRPSVLTVIEDVRPDLICCFGSEWPFGLVSSEVKVPVVIHMQGHWGSYLKEWRKVESDSQLFRFLHYNPFRMLKTLVRHHFEHLSVQREVQIMKQNRFYLGRTDWDKQLVEQYSPGANYFHCEEAIRSVIVNASKHWQPQEGRMQLVTISSASELKGNGFILKTARLLKQRGVDFVWKVAGRKEIFHKFECYTGIHHEEVNVELLGLIDAYDIVELLSCSTAYVHTAIIDNSPNSLCEAQLMGCPVVTTPVGGIPQLVTESQTGLFVAYDDPEALASCLIRLSNDVELQRRLSAQEKAMAHHRHDGASIAQRLHEIYDNIIDTYNNT